MDVAIGRIRLPDFPAKTFPEKILLLERDQLSSAPVSSRLLRPFLSPSLPLMIFCVHTPRIPANFAPTQQINGSLSDYEKLETDKTTLTSLQLF